MTLEDHDPYDYARADRVFPPSSKVTAQFELMSKHFGPRDLEIELCGEFGDARPARIIIKPDGIIEIAGTRIADPRSANGSNSRSVPIQRKEISTSSSTTPRPFTFNLRTKRIYSTAWSSAPANTVSCQYAATKSRRGAIGQRNRPNMYCEP